MPEPRPSPLETLEAIARETGAAADDPVVREARMLATGEAAQPVWDALAAALAWAESLEDGAA